MPVFCLSPRIPSGIAMEDKLFWTEFLTLYKELTSLWKIKSKEYGDKYKKAAEYEILLKKLREKYPESTKEILVKKLNNMRTAFRREFNKAEKSRKSGCGAEEVYSSNLWYYELLMFTKDQETPSRSVSNLDELAFSHEETINEDGPEPRDMGEELEEVRANSALSTSFASVAAAPKRKRGKKEELSESDKVLAALTKRITSSREEDEWNTAGKNVAHKLRRAPSSMQPIAEKLINDVLYLAQTNALDGNTQVVRGPLSFALQ